MNARDVIASEFQASNQRVPDFGEILRKVKPDGDRALSEMIDEHSSRVIARDLVPHPDQYISAIRHPKYGVLSLQTIVSQHELALIDVKGFDAAQAKAMAKEAIEATMMGPGREHEPGDPDQASEDQSSDDGSILIEEKIRILGASKKSLQYLRAADESRVRIRPIRFVYVIGVFLLGAASAYLTQEQFNEANKQTEKAQGIVRDFWDSDFFDRAKLDAGDWPDQPWRNRPWELRVESDWRHHKKLFDCSHTLEDWKRRFPDEHGHDAGSMPAPAESDAGDL